MIFFTSDTHFGHFNIIRHDGRPFSSIQEHDDALIDRWNAVVGSKDQVYHLGDFFFRCSIKHAAGVLHKLNGRIFALQGNHDGKTLKKLQAFSAEKITYMGAYHELKYDKKMPVILCHYPIQSWNRMSHGSWHLHGHSHGKLKETPDWFMRLDVGSPCHDYTPISIERVAELMEPRAKKARERWPKKGRGLLEAV
jgi:calcineurin-like phosphoesterase family protein